MATAPLPTPQYIDYETNVKPYIGTDKVLVSDTATNAVPTALADQLIAEGEGLALIDLSPYFITVPALITTDGGLWTTLPAQTYSTLYYMFVAQASMKLIGNFIARNTDEDGRTLSYFQNFYEREYNKYHNRIDDLLKNGSYKYQLIGLQSLSTGIQRKPSRYAISGNLGANNYTDRQVINPARNFDSFWGPYKYGSYNK